MASAAIDITLLYLLKVAFYLLKVAFYLLKVAFYLLKNRKILKNHKLRRIIIF